MTSAKPKRFSTLAFTAPTAEEPIRQGVTPPVALDAETHGRPEFTPPSSQDAVTPSSPAAKTPRSRAVKADKRTDIVTDIEEDRRPAVEAARRISFSWRLTPEQADSLDAMILDLRRKLGRGRLDRAAFLHALVELAEEREDVREELLARLDR